MTDTTHAPGCWSWGPRHYECAVGQIEHDEALLRQALGEEVERLRRGAHPAITHCDNCGCDWLDNGLNPIGCPYCKQPAAAGPEASGQKPMTLVDVCLKDAEELREIAAHFDALWDEVKGDFLREVANRHEFLAGAYQTSTVRYER